MDVLLIPWARTDAHPRTVDHTWHHLFDQHYVIILPTWDMMTRFIEEYTTTLTGYEHPVTTVSVAPGFDNLHPLKKSKLYDNESVFEYHAIPLYSMNHLKILREKPNALGDGAEPITGVKTNVHNALLPTAVETEVITYPFDKLGPLRSHVHPHFVLARTAHLFWKAGYNQYITSAVSVFGKPEREIRVRFMEIQDLGATWRRAVRSQRTKACTGGQKSGPGSGSGGPLPQPGPSELNPRRSTRRQGGSNQNTTHAQGAPGGVQEFNDSGSSLIDDSGVEADQDEDKEHTRIVRTLQDVPDERVREWRIRVPQVRAVSVTTCVLVFFC